MGPKTHLREEARREVRNLTWAPPLNMVSSSPQYILVMYTITNAIHKGNGGVAHILHHILLARLRTLTAGVQGTSVALEQIITDPTFTYILTVI